MLNRVTRIGRWIAARLKDLVYGPGNQTLDIGRVIALWSILTLVAAAAWNAYLKKEIDLGPAGLGGGMAAVLGAAVIYIYKDRGARGGES